MPAALAAALMVRPFVFSPALIAGAAIAANKLQGIRAGVAHDSYTAHQMVEHDDVNVLALGSRVVGEALAEDLVKAYIEAKFSREDRHVRRLDKIKSLEA